MDQRKPLPREQGRDENTQERRTGNLILLLLLAVIVGVGVWLINTMLDQRTLDDCVAQGRRNCAPVAGATDRQ